MQVRKAKNFSVKKQLVTGRPISLQNHLDDERLPRASFRPIYLPGFHKKTSSTAVTHSEHNRAQHESSVRCRKVNLPWPMAVQFQELGVLERREIYGFRSLFVMTSDD